MLNHPCATDYNFVFKEKVATKDSGLLYIWTASTPTTACANGASLSASKLEASSNAQRVGVLRRRDGQPKKWAWRLNEYNVSKDCNRWHHTFRSYLPGPPPPGAFEPPQNISCTPLESHNGLGGGVYGQESFSTAKSVTWYPGQSHGLDEDSAALHLVGHELVNDGERLRRMQETLAREKLGWEAGASPRMRNLTLLDAARLAGTKRRPPGSPQRLLQRTTAQLTGTVSGVKLGRELASDSGRGLPAEFDARDAWPQCNASVSRVRDQGVCGSCWAFGAVEAFADRLCIASLAAAAAAAAAAAPPANAAASWAHKSWPVAAAATTNLVLSPEYLLSCARACDGCDGGYVDEAWRFLRDHGVDDEDCTPYRQAEEAGGCPAGWCVLLPRAPVCLVVVRRIECA